MRFYLVVFPVLASLTALAQQNNDSAFKNKADSIKQASSYFQAATTFGNSYFSTKNKNIDASQQSNSFVFTPSVSYFNKSGLGLTASAYHIKGGGNSGFYQYISHRYTFFCLLPYGFIIQNGSANAFLQTRRCNNKFSITTSHFNRLWNTSLCKTLIACPGAFIHCQQSFVVGKELLYGIF